MRAPWSERLLVFGAPMLLVGLGAAGVSGAGPISIGGVLFMVGALLAIGAAWTLPWETVVGPEGIEVRSLVQNRKVLWDELERVDRHGRRGGALVVHRIDGTRLPLATVTETPTHWDQLREMVGEYAPDAAFTDPPPGHPFAET